MLMRSVIILSLFGVACVFSQNEDNAMKTNEIEAGEGIILEYDSPLVLQCVYTDKPDEIVHWKKDGAEINNTLGHYKMSENNTITVEKPTDEDAGVYTCHHGDDSAVITVRTKARILKPFHKSVNMAEGSRLSLFCEVSGIPLPTIKWLKDGVLIEADDKRVSITDEKDIENARMTIDSLEFEDRANYTCNAENPVHTANTTILVRVTDKYAALWPFLGICAEVAVLCTIIFVYEKRRSKNDFNESDTDNCADMKNTADHKGQDIRQRK